MSEQYDVAVVGGGSAGLAAAVTAARAGARTILLERYGYLGGMGTASLVHTFCGLYLLSENDEAAFANPGFASEIAEKMISETGLKPIKMGRVHVLPQHPTVFVKIADDLTASEPELDLWLHTEVLAVNRVNDMWKVHVGGRGGMSELSARKLIDASGDAVIADFLGHGTDMTESSRLQRPAYIVGIHGMDEFGDEARLRTAGLIVEGVRGGLVSQEALGMSFRPSGRRGEIFGSLDLVGEKPSAPFDPLDLGCLATLEKDGRRIASEVVRYLSQHHELWKNAYISQWPVRAGVRESRRWHGEYTLRGEDLLSSKRFDDEVALATWPMEFRETTKGPKLRFPLQNQPAGIPLRCLKPIGIQDLYVAGRCISVDHEVHASIRVMGTCFATGEAAAKAAVTGLML